jgi:hypothetical protein
MTSPVKVADVRRVATGITDEFTKYDLLTYSSAFALNRTAFAMLTLAAIGPVGRQSLYPDHVAPTLRNDLSRSASNLVNRTALEAMDSKRLWWAVSAVAFLLGVTVDSLLREQMQGRSRRGRGRTRAGT